MFAREALPVVGPGAALGLLGSMSQTFTAAGTTQATATSITSVFTNITTATEGQGAILPGSMNVSDSGKVCNSSSVDVYIYPPVGYAINGATTNYPFMLAPNKSVGFVCIDSNNYMVG